MSEKIDFEAEARAWCEADYENIGPLDGSVRKLAAKLAENDARARDEVRLEHERGDPPRGSRLWRCELELNKARAEIETTRSEGQADGYRRGVEAVAVWVDESWKQPDTFPGGDDIRAALLPPEPAKPLGLSPIGLTEEQARQLEADAAKVIAPEPARCTRPVANVFCNDHVCPIHGARR